MGYGLVKHDRRKIARAFRRGNPKKPKNVGINVEINRHLRVKWRGGIPHVQKRGGEFEALACLRTHAKTTYLHRRVGRNDRRCAFGAGHSPTVALKRAVSKLMKKIR